MTTAFASDFNHVRGPSVKGLMASAYVVLFLLIAGLGGLSAAVSLSGAIVTYGRFVVASYPKPVQHLKGGTVDALLVENGDSVSAGQLLVRLDDTQIKASLGIINKRLNELRIRSARLLAEETGRSLLSFPQDIRQAAEADTEMAELMHGETRLFDARRSATSRRKAQLTERTAQFNEQIRGLKAQIEGKRDEIALIQKEAGGIRALVERHLATQSRLMAIERAEAQLRGQIGGLVSSVAQVEGRISETKLQSLQIDDDLKSEASSALRDAQAQIAELEERRLAAEDELARIEIRAPQKGIVQDLTVHASGAVLGAGAPVLTIIPVQDSLVAEVRVAPHDVDQVFVGQSATLRLSAYNQRTTPEISGEIVNVSADLIKDRQTGEYFYLVRVAPDADDLAGLKTVDLLPGMPCEVFLQTAPRTILSYLLQPALDQVNRAFRED